ncbi:hypothetical protein T03_16238 [Trichinella britovi]|uniref:Uncharacterized protein n=1 Tax=Trichinella britovi TaxID=45882 RepID=A0A0V1DF04_TRIBR|nr:hypothetical protein T03_16238 [Trichinella britovi]
MEKLSHKTVNIGFQDVPQGFQVPHELLVCQSYRGPSVHEHAAPCFTHRALHNRGFDLRGPYDNDGKSSLSTAYLGCALIAGENLALPADVAHSAAWPTTPALSLSFLPAASLLGRRPLRNRWSVARQQFLQLLQQLREVSPASLRVVTAAAADPVTSLSASSVSRSASFSTEETLALSVVISLTITRMRASKGDEGEICRRRQSDKLDLYARSRTRSLERQWTRVDFIEDFITNNIVNSTRKFYEGQNTEIKPIRTSCWEQNYGTSASHHQKRRSTVAGGVRVRVVIDHCTFVFTANRSSSLNKAGFHCLILRCYTFEDERRSYCG